MSINIQSLFNEVNELKNDYVRNKSEFISNHKNGPLKPKHIYFEVGENNQTFTNLCMNVDSIKEHLQWKFDPIEVDIRCHTMESSVNDILRVHPVITVTFGNIGMFRLAPHGSNQIELTTIVVEPYIKSKGMGSLMMICVLGMINEHMSDDFDTIMLECVGSLGQGDLSLKSSIKEQTKFFRKFGFRVVKDSKNPDGTPSYVQMNYFSDKLDETYLSQLMYKTSDNK
jgi:N-acetylglutamate synthase-like GNAT family acetyltransferase